MSPFTESADLLLEAKGELHKVEYAVATSSSLKSVANLVPREAAMNPSEALVMRTKLLLRGLVVVLKQPHPFLRKTVSTRPRRSVAIMLVLNSVRIAPPRSRGSANLWRSPARDRSR